MRSIRERHTIAEVSEYAQNELMSLIIREGSEECWAWGGPTNGFGFPIFNMDGIEYSAPRVLYAIAHGEPIPTQNVMHNCRTRACMNPKHLVQHRSLTQNQHDEIIRLGCQFPIREIQRRMGLSFTMIQKTLAEWKTRN